MRKMILIMMLAVLSVGLFAIGGDDFATAVLVTDTDFPYTDTGDTNTLTNTIENASADAFYRINSPFAITDLDISLGESSFDTYLHVYAADQTTMLHYNDDAIGNRSALYDLTLDANTDYYVIVEGYGSNEGNYQIDMTAVIDNPAAPTAVSNMLPTDAFTVTTLSPELSWTFGALTETYDLYFDTVNPPVTQVVTDGTAGEEGTAGNYIPDSALSEGTYYWYVVAKNSSARLQAASAVYSFDIDMTPGEVTNALPLNGATDQPVNTQISWDFDTLAETYDLYFDSVNPPVVQVVTDGTVNGSGAYNPGRLAQSTTYYWKVVSKNSNAANDTEETYSFTTVLSDNIVSIGTGAETNQGLPIEPFYGYTYTQSIYLQSEIDMADQRIEKIWFHYNGASNLDSSSEWVIYMAHTNLEEFGTTDAWLPAEQLTQVYAQTLDPIPTEDSWIELVLDSPFTYNNVDNLVIAVEENQSSYDSSSDEFFCTSVVGNRSITYRNDSNNPDPSDPPSGTLKAYIPNIRMEFGDVPEMPEFSINPESYNFGMVYVNADSDAQIFTITNNGGADLVINDPIALETGANFTLTDANTYPLTIPSTMSASFDVTFNATSVGVVNDNIVIIDNITRTTRNIPVQGEGFDPIVSVFPYTESFDTADLPLEWVADPDASSNGWEVANNEAGGHGATSDHTGNSGYMMVLDDSSPETVPAHLYTPDFNFAGLTSPVMSFWYWIGDNSNTSELHIDVINGEVTTESVAVFTDADGDLGWQQGVVSLTAFAGQTVSFDFRAMESSSYFGDLSIDDVEIFNNVNPPAVATVVAPVDAATEQLTEGTLEWNAVPFADGYDLYFGSDNPPTDIVNGADQGNVTTYAYSALTGGATYYWQVVPYNANGSAVDCPVWSFTTNATPPAPVALVSPADEAIDQDFNLTLEWNTDAVADGYYLNFGTDNPPTDVEDMTDMGTATTYDAVELSGATTYYWQVIPYNANGNATDCPVWSFTTYAAAPEAITYNNPADAAEGVSEYPTLSWYSDVWADGYNLYISDDGENYVQTDVGVVTAVTLTTALNYETQYYWYVTGYNRNGEGVAPDAIRTFTTQSNPNYGGDGTLYGGYYFANSVPDGNGLGYQPTFSWVDVVEANAPTYTSADDGYATVDLNFTFNYFGNDYTQIYLGTNGYVMFSSPVGSTGGSMSIPASGTPNDVIALSAMDMHTTQVATTNPFYGYDVDGNFVYTVEQWNDYSDYDEFMDMQVIIYTNGRIKIQYRNYSNGGTESGTSTIQGDACIGIENADGTVGIQYRNNGVGGPMLDDMAVAFATSAEALADGSGPVVLDAPANFTLEYLAGDLVLNWDAVTGATAYNVYVGTTPDFTCDVNTLIGIVTETTASVPATTFDGNYRFAKVTATDEAPSRTVVSAPSTFSVRRSLRTITWVEYIEPTPEVEKKK